MNFAEKAHEGDSQAVWQLVRILKRCRKHQKVAQAPVHNAQGCLIKDNAAVTTVWVRQLTEEFVSGNVVGVSPAHAHCRLAERRIHECLQLHHESFPTTNGSHDFPSNVEEWMDFLQIRLARAKQ